MKLQVLGIGNAFTARHYNTSFLLQSEKLLLIDGPHSLFRALGEVGRTPEEIEGVVVTHVHGDHTSGLETLILWKRYSQGRRLPIYTTRRVFEDLRTRFFPRFSQSFSGDFTRVVDRKFEDYVVLCELDETERTRLDDALAVEVRYNWHPATTLGLKLIAADGTVGIGGDTCFRPELLDRLLAAGRLTPERHERLTGDWLWSADLVYHEADRAQLTSHTLERDLLALPEAVRRKLRLIHCADDFKEKGISLAHQKEVVDFEAPGIVRIRLAG